ncbi:L-idonate 5-dehydrogenase (plasmid) [Aureimonas ureilytica]|uniref:L-idonate 5-dehydrogenase n=1 Tax=Aureimonas ureilytica TaxID=401562 RepID=UPI003CFB669D
MSDRIGTAATLHAAEDLRLDTRDLGPLAPTQVRIRFGAGGICGSDMHYFRHARTGDFVLREPLVLGHEVAGMVEAVGAEVEGLSVGTRVAVNPSRVCGHCPRCREGRSNLCENVFFMGSASKYPHMQGGFATRFDVAPEQCVAVPDTLPLEAAALAEPLAVSLHAVARAGDVSGRSALVVGAGPIGLLVLLCLRAAGAGPLKAADVAQAPLALAARLGAERTVNLGEADAAQRLDAPDIVFEVSGTPAGLATAIAAVRRGGTVIQVGNLPGGAIEAPMNAVMAKEIDLRGTLRFTQAEFHEAVDHIAAGRIDVLSLVSARLPLSEAREAFRLALDRTRSVKVMLTGGDAAPSPRS